ncbi:MAG: hypothetical protein WAX66_01565 [Patescibacteria group bacterium]
MKKDEDKIRKRIVAALREFLSRSGDKEQVVKNVHGISEYGIDIEFYIRDFTGYIHCYGMQVKAGNLCCGANPNKGVKEIIGQLAIASGKKSIRQSDSELDFSGFYVVVEGNISEDAMRYIKASFHNNKPIYFFYGEELESFLVKNEPKNLTTEQL